MLKLQSQAKKFKTAETKFFVAGDLAHVPNSPNMHFSTSIISGKGKNSRALRSGEPSR
jgi:hypothetical protein